MISNCGQRTAKITRQSTSCRNTSADVTRAVRWYQKMFACEVKWQDETWALLQFANTSLALVVPGEHPPHLAFTMEEVEEQGELKTHRDGTRSVYISDSEGNVIECMDAASV